MNKGTHAKQLITKLETEPMYKPVDHSPAGVLANALDRGMDIEKLERILELQIKYEENEAKKAYHKAMAAFKADPPEIYKDKQVDFKSKKGGADTSYSHASLHNVSSMINKALSKHGLSSAFKTDQGEGGITVTCTITHELGHSESTTLKAGADNTGNKNSIQAIGSTISYLERYTLLALTGLATKDMDDDGVAAVSELISEEDVEKVTNLINETDSDKPEFWRYIGFETVDTITTDALPRVMKALMTKRKKVTREPGEEG